MVAKHSKAWLLRLQCRPSSLDTNKCESFLWEHMLPFKWLSHPHPEAVRTASNAPVLSVEEADKAQCSRCTVFSSVVVWQCVLHPVRLNRSSGLDDVVISSIYKNVDDLLELCPGNSMNGRLMAPS